MWHIVNVIFIFCKGLTWDAFTKVMTQFKQKIKLVQTWNFPTKVVSNRVIKPKYKNYK